MVWHRIEDPADLERLSTGDLADSVWPLVRRGGKAATSKAWRERVAENIPSLCAELAAEWKLSPRLHGREVGFGEYFAAKVGWKLHQLDRQQNPHLYDGHGTYRPEQETLPLYLANHSDKVRPDAP